MESKHQKTHCDVLVLTFLIAWLCEALLIIVELHNLLPGDYCRVLINADWPISAMRIGKDTYGETLISAKQALLTAY